MAENSAYIFNYLDDMWSMLPELDRLRFAETWKAYERTYGDVWTRLFEIQMGGNIDYLPLYNNQRWLQYTFDDTTILNLTATYTSQQDLSMGINLQDRYLIKVGFDGNTPLEIDLRGQNPAATTLAEIVKHLNTAFGQVVAYAVTGNALLEFSSTTSGPNSDITFYPTSDPTHDASEIILGFDPAVDLPKTLPQFRYSFQLPDSTIAAIPQLQDKVHDDLVTTLLTQAVDFAVEFGTGIISFALQPPTEMWAKNTLINKETPYNNYGFLLNIYNQNTDSYRKAVQGLWFAFWTGPSPQNIQRSLCLLFGLPTAAQAGTVELVTDTQVSVNYVDGTSEVFNIPSGLLPIVSSGDTLTKFQPVCSGINVYDKINFPGFIASQVGPSGIKHFLTQNATYGSGPNTDQTRAVRLLEENTYLPQIDVSAFISPNISLANVQTFLSTLQPKSRTFLFQVLIGQFADLFGLMDDGPTGMTNDTYPNGIPAVGFGINFDVTPNVDWNPNTFAQQSDLDDAENNPYTYMTLDEGTAISDFASVEVYSFSSLIDSFTLEG